MVCRKERHGGLLQSGRGPLADDIPGRMSIPGRRSQIQSPWGGRDLECEDVKTRPQWLELTGRGVKWVQMRSQR